MLKNKINLYLITYAIDAILRQKTKNLFIVIIFTILTFILCSVFFITTSIRYELDSTVNSLPQIIVQKIKAGKAYDLDSSMVDDIIEIAGVSDATERVWGYYYFVNGGVNFTVVGLDQYEKQYKKTFSNLIKQYDLSSLEQNSSMIVGSGVKDVMTKSYYDRYFNFIRPDGTFKKLYISGVFHSDIELESNDIIVLTKDDARDLFGIDEDMATDIVVSVANPKEIPTIAQKIKLLYPDTRIITNEDLKVSYANIFDYKSGVFLAIFIVALFTFFMVVYDKSSGLSAQEKKEIGILKAIGWTVDDVLKEKFYESFIVSFLAYLFGIILAFVFVYIFQAPLLENIFTGYSKLKTTFTLPFVFDFQTLFLVFFLSVPIYIAATIIPSWRVATLETDEVIR